MMMYQSEQEKIGRTIISSLFGNIITFTPEVVENVEPSDLAIVWDRVAILFYLHKSNSVIEKKIIHNISQGRKWLRHWESGKPLIGKVNSEAVSYDFGDVDDVVVVSIINGNGAGITRFQPKHHYVEKYKLRYEVNVSEGSLALMSDYNISILDFLRILRDLGEDASIGNKQLNDFLISIVQGYFISAGCGGVSQEEMFQFHNDIGQGLRNVSLQDEKLAARGVRSLAFVGLRQTAFLAGMICSGNQRLARVGGNGTETSLSAKCDFQHIGYEDYSIACIIGANSSIIASDECLSISNELSKYVDFVYTMNFDDQSGECGIAFMLFGKRGTSINAAHVFI